MNRIYFIIFSIYLIVILIRIRVKKIKRKDKVIAIGSIECDYSTFFMGVAWFLVSVINFKTYSDCRTVYGTESYSFYVGMVQVSLGIFYLIRSFDKTIICEDRIYFKNKYCKWEKIESYVWGELKRKQGRKKHLEYYCLQFEIETFTLKRMIKYKIKIKANDKEKVEELLKEK